MDFWLNFWNEIWKDYHSTRGVQAEIHLARGHSLIPTCIISTISSVQINSCWSTEGIMSWPPTMVNPICQPLMHPQWPAPDASIQHIWRRPSGSPPRPASQWCSGRTEIGVGSRHPSETNVSYMFVKKEGFQSSVQIAETLYTWCVLRHFVDSWSPVPAGMYEFPKKKWDEMQFTYKNERLELRKNLGKKETSTPNH